MQEEKCKFCGQKTGYFDWRLGIYICVECLAKYDKIKEDKE